MTIVWLVMNVITMIGISAAIPLFLVAVIVRLCEWSWEKPTGSMGSRGMFWASLVLAAPFLLWALRLYLASAFRV